MTPTVDLSHIDAVFGSDGVMAKKFPGYLPRTAQVDGAKAAAETFELGRVMMGEFPTGCHVAGQGILLHDGRVKLVEDIEVGDALMGPDGPRRVLALARGRQETVEIVPVKGESWTVNIDHILTLVHTGTSEIVDVSAREWIGWSKNRKHLHKLFRVGCSFGGDAASFKLAPYHLGMILGDGHLSTTVSVCKADREIEDECWKLARAFGLSVRTEAAPGRKTHHFSRRGHRGPEKNPLHDEIKRLGLWGCKSGGKFIPLAYKTSSAIDRAEVLAGLLDTDGSMTCGGYDYISKSRQLADDVAFIARSLGLAAYVKPTQKKWQNGSGEYYRVSISGDCSSLPLRITRKKAPARNQNKDVRRTGFKVVPTGKVENYYGFTLSGDGRYLLDDFTVTHNTGKSIMYLVAGIMALQRQKRPTKLVVVTSNIALQEQIVTKDLPALQDILGDLGVTFTFALAKGFSNYACKAQLDACDPTQIKLGRDDPTVNLTFDEKRHLTVIREWSQTTETGDLSELEEDPSGRVKQLVTIPSDECEGRKCVHYDNCHPRKARKKFAAADVVVTNYHLFCIDLAVRASGGQGVLPTHKFLVLDEAHEFPNIAREYFGMKSGFFSVRAAVAELQATGRRATKLGLPRDVAPELRVEIEREATWFFDDLNTLRKDRDRYKARLDRKGMIGGVVLESKLRDAAKEYGKAAAEPELPTAAIDFLRARADLCLKHANLIRDARSLEDRERVYYLADKGPDRTELVSEPVTAAKFLKAHLWKTDEERAESDTPTGIFVCSATLATDGGKSGFDFFASKAGIDNAEEMITDSPFDYSRVSFIIPTKADLGGADTAARDDSFNQGAARVLVDAVRRAGGRTLGLFTSNKGVETAHRALKAAGLPFKIMKQGEAPRTKLIERFKADETSVLLGTNSFWTGVDVPGPSLSCLFIDKLPFPQFNDPIMDAIKESNPDGWFAHHYVPEALLMYKQGFGRLIRRVTDYGVVVCCDRRILEKPYGKRFQRALPAAVEISQDMDDIARVLGRYAGELDNPHWRRELKVE